MRPKSTTAKAVNFYTLFRISDLELGIWLFVLVPGQGSALVFGNAGFESSVALTLKRRALAVVYFV